MSNETTNVTVCPFTADQVLAHRYEISAIHAAAFGTGGEGARRYERESLPEMTRMPGFVAAVAQRHGEIVGFACGHDATPHQPWANRVYAALVKDGFEAWTRDPFEFADIAILPGMQNRGIGRLLLDAIITNVPHRFCILVTFHGPHPAKRFYLRAGWITLVEDFEYLPGRPLTSILGLDLTAHPKD